MEKENKADFQEKLETTYEKFIVSMVGSMYDILKLFQEEVGREKMIDILTEFSEDKGVDSIKKMQKSGDLNIGDFEDFKEYLLKELDSDNLKNTLSYKVEEVTENSFKYTVTECLWAKVFKEFGIKDVGYELLCRKDIVQAKEFHPNIELKREKTLMQGNDECDFKYVWED